ncbi:MAG: LysM domain-containing protein [Anaerolineae bacterium]|nr:LysM domain-containing protein [Anaerolineae bacterium]
MFEPGSRYTNLETATLDVVDEHGETRVISYKRRRFIPSTQGTTTLVEHTVREGERLDNITAYYLGDPLQFWRVCDANLVLQPGELTAQPGQIIRIALPKV